MRSTSKVPKQSTRREFLGTCITGIAGATAGLASAVPATPQGTQAKRYAMVGTGSRGTSMWGESLLKSYPKHVKFVGLCDINPKRVEYAKTQIGAPDAKTYTDFDRMIRETQPDVVIVTTVDAFHAKYAVRAMELGCDVIVEKPMATDEHQCQQIIDTERRTGRHVTVTFNARYGNSTKAIKNILLTGEIGKIVSVDFHEYLDIEHGAHYFRRWHAYIKNSGSLLVHKSTHHFDLINWWIDADPVEVYAQGRVSTYGKNSPFRGKTCRSCPHSDTCAYYWDITKDQKSMDLYVAAEDVDHYYRDACVFREDIDTYDVMGVQVKYTKGIQLSYSLHAFSPYEGGSIAFNGTNGRVEKRFYSNRRSWPKVEGESDIRTTINFKESRTETVRPGVGSHGGSDAKLKDHVLGIRSDDPLKRKAGTRAGALSALIGIAARHSIESGKPVRIDDLVTL